MTETCELLLPKVSDTRDAPKGPDIFYRCLRCGVLIPSQPRENTECRCGNIGIDVDYFRLWVDDFEFFQPVRIIRCPTQGGNPRDPEGSTPGENDDSGGSAR